MIETKIYQYLLDRGVQRNAASQMASTIDKKYEEEIEELKQSYKDSLISYRDASQKENIRLEQVLQVRRKRLELFWEWITTFNIDKEYADGFFLSSFQYWCVGFSRKKQYRPEEWFDDKGKAN